MSFCDSSPDGSELGVVFDSLALEDVSYSLAEVELCVLLVFNSLDLEQGVLLTLGSLTSFEACEDSFLVQSTEQRLDRLLLT